MQVGKTRAMRLDGKSKSLKPSVLGFEIWSAAFDPGGYCFLMTSGNFARNAKLK
jgi:hypothetical protein